METTYTQLEEDEERFHKLQLTDQANFNDKLDTLSVSTFISDTLMMYHSGELYYNHDVWF